MTTRSTVEKTVTTTRIGAITLKSTTTTSLLSLYDLQLHYVNNEDINVVNLLRQLKVPTTIVLLKIYILL